MNKHTEHTGITRWIKVPLWIIGCLLVLVLILRLSLKTTYVQNFVKSYAISIANEQLNAKVTIDNLTGDLWQEVHVTDLRLIQKDTIAQIDSLYANYELLSLIGGQFQVNQISVTAPLVNLRQEKGQWNFENIIDTAPDTVDQDTSGGGFPFRIDDIQVQQGTVLVSSDSLPAESQFAVRDLALSSSFEMEEEQVSGNLRNLSLQIEQTQLNSPLEITSSARADSNSIKLEQLVLATGNSLISSSGSVHQGDSTLQFNLTASPFSWQDAAQYARDIPLRQDVEVDLNIGGSLQNLQLTLDLQADGLEAMQLAGRFQWDSGLVMREFSVKGKRFNPEVLISDTTLPAIQHFDFLMEGEVYFDNYEKSIADVDFTMGGVESSAYQFDSISGDVALKKEEVRADLFAQQNSQELSSELTIKQLWSKLPAITARIEGSQINPGFWMQNSSLNGELYFTSEISGRGFFPDTTLWDYSFNMSDSHINGQPISALSLEGLAGSKRATVDGSLSFGDGRIILNADAEELEEVPYYSFRLESHNVDIGSFISTENITTALNMSISGEGMGIEPASMRLNSTISVDSTLVNEEIVENLEADVRIQDSIAVIDNTTLQSSIVEGSFEGQFNMLHPYSRKSDLALKLKLRDVSTLGPVLGTDTLEAEGTLTGNINPVAKERLQFTGDMDLSGIQYSSYQIDQLVGHTEVILQDDIEYQVDLELSTPEFSGIRLQGLNLFTQGVYSESETAEGEIGMEFNSLNEGEVEYSANYKYSQDETRINTTELNIASDLKTLRLKQPFELTMQEDRIQMDTLHVSSGDTAYLEVALPLVTSDEQQGYVQGENLNLVTIQQALFEEPYIEGLFSGRAAFTRKDTTLDARGELLLADLAFNGVTFDSLSAAGSVEKERLQGRLAVHRGDTTLIDGAIDLPFKLEDPEELTAAFFEQPVSGHLTIHDITLDQFEEKFTEANITETSGVFSFTGTLDGTAGQPELSAGGSLRQAVVSGVKVDSITAGIKYNHMESVASLDASVTSMSQKAAEIDLLFPLSINMKTFEVDLPQERDTIAATVKTDDFNLSAVDDFMDPQTTTDISGRLNGTVNISGAIEDLQSEGQLTVQNGSLRVVPAGVVVDNIESTIDFAPNEIRLTRFSAESNGKLNAKGVIQLEELMPGPINIQVKAQNFQVANTDEYNAIINLDAQAQGTATQPELTGSLHMVSGFIELDNFGEKSVEDVELDTIQQEENSFSAYDSLRLEMEVSFDRRFFVRNQRYLEMEIELGGQVDLVKGRGEDMQLFGSMNTEDGYALPLGKRFDLQEGIVTFSGDPGNPKLNIRTQYEPPETEEEIIIWYIIEGTVENPQFVYESQPQMELENILSYTLFGQPFYALDSWEQLVTSSGDGNGGTTATDVALDVLLERVETVATQRLGIDVVRIENTRLGGENATSVTTGWYLNPRVFFAIQNIITGSSPTTGFLLEYMLRQNLELIIRQGSGIREGVDVRWEYDY